MSTERVMGDGVDEAVRQLREAAAAKKCRTCGCLHGSVTAIERAISADRHPELAAALRNARERFAPVKYDCLGCSVCHFAIAVNALSPMLAERDVELEACPTEAVSERDGWPPLPGSYRVLRYLGPVAICTLNDESLTFGLAAHASEDVALVGAMRTENLGVERLILNVLANPNIRFLILCGPDSEQVIGHLPGQSLVALSENGVDERKRIIGAYGKRPVLKNISGAAIDHFRRTVEVLDHIGTSDSGTLMPVVAACAAKNPGPADPFTRGRTIHRVGGYLPPRMVPDPGGYFVVYVDRRRRLLALEHYRKDGVLDTLIEGHAAAELYTPAIEKGLVSRLDHGAYLGRELARAEAALQSGTAYTQDAAPEQGLPRTDAGCGCAPSSTEGA